MHPLPHLFADRFGFRGNLEIDRHGVSLGSGLLGVEEWHIAGARQRQRQTKFEVLVVPAFAGTTWRVTCPISPISSPATPPNGSTPSPAASSPGSAATGRRYCCCTGFPKPM